MADTVTVTITSSPGVTAVTGFCRTLLLTTDDTVLHPSGSGKVKVYSRLSEVADDFASSTEPYKAAQKYFGRDPHPKPLLVGRWTDADQNKLIRGSAPAAVSVIIAIDDGSIFYPGSNEITGLDFTGDNSYATIAARLQTALRAATGADGGETVTYESSPGRFVVDIGDPVDGGTAIADGATGTTTIGDSLGLTSESGAESVTGGEAEAADEALDAILNVNSSFYFFGLEADLNGTATVAVVSAWAASNGRRLAAESNESGALTASETSSEAAKLSALQPGRTFGTWSETGDYKSLSVAGAFSAVDWNGVNSLITAKFQRLPNTLPDNLTSTQIDELFRKKFNFYVPEFGVAIYKEGQNLDASWIDDTVWLDWIVSEIRLAEFNHFLTAGRIALTPAGLLGFKEVIEDACRKGIRNGGIAPGQVSSALATTIRDATGDSGFDGYLSNGYLVYMPPAETLSAADRASRTPPTYQVWLKGSGAAHFIDANLVFVQ